jgi:hypothetical protein
MLELGRISSWFLGHVDQVIGTFQVTVVFGDDINDEVSRVLLTDALAIDDEFAERLQRDGVGVISHSNIP